MTAEPRSNASGPGGLAFDGQRVLVVGLGITGQSVISLLAGRGASVTAVDSRNDAERQELAERLARDGVQVRLGRAELGAEADVPPDTALVVTSPGLRPDTPLLAH